MAAVYSRLAPAHHPSASHHVDQKQITQQPMPMSPEREEPDGAGDSAFSGNKSD